MSDKPFRYKVELLRNDMTLKGWVATDLARAANVSDMTVHRFFKSGQVTARTVKKLADALGFTVRRYVPAMRVVRRTRTRRAVA